jgi:hypothetical protein
MRRRRRRRRGEEEDEDGRWSGAPSLSLSCLDLSRVENKDREGGVDGRK